MPIKKLSSQKRIIFRAKKGTKKIHITIIPNKVFAVIRQANCTLKWSILHTNPLSQQAEATKRLKAVRDQVLRDFQYNELKVIDLLLNLSQLEFNVREIYRRMVEGKQAQWEDLKREAHERTQELSEVFSGTKPLTRIAKNENLEKW